jgi:hypothetical protein
MWRIKFLIIGIIILFLLSFSAARKAYAEDAGKIVILIQPAVSGWTNVAKVNGIDEANLSKFNGVAHDSINKIGGIAVNK